MPTSKGLDSAKSLASVARKLAADGYGFVCRYYFNHSGFKDLLTHAEAVALSAAGLYIVAVYENGFPTQASYFTAAQGKADASIAFNRAVAAGQPPNTPIYFAVDYDAKPEDVSLYFAAVRDQLRSMGSHYLVGVYGSGAVCAYLEKHGLAAKGWLAQSRGWQGYKAAQCTADIEQGRETTVLGLDVDTDISHGRGDGRKVAG